MNQMPSLWPPRLAETTKEMLNYKLRVRAIKEGNSPTVENQ